MSGTEWPRRRSAANFLTDPNGQSGTASGSGLLFTTQGSADADVSKTYVAGAGTAGEAIGLTTKAVSNAIGGGDRLMGGTGNDVLIGNQGDDTLDGGDDTDIAQFTGSYADYRITRLDSTTTYRVVDTVAGRDGADLLSNIEQLSFADVSSAEVTLDNPGVAAA